MASTPSPAPTRASSSPLSIRTLVAGICGGFAIVTITGLIAGPLAGVSSSCAGATGRTSGLDNRSCPGANGSGVRKRMASDSVLTGTVTVARSCVSD